MMLNDTQQRVQGGAASLDVSQGNMAGGWWNWRVERSAASSNGSSDIGGLRLRLSHSLLWGGMGSGGVLQGVACWRSAVCLALTYRIRTMALQGVACSPSVLCFALSHRDGTIIL